MQRSRPELIEPILDAMKWLGLRWDDEIVYQSLRLDHYRTAAQRILQSGRGYRCFCAPEQLAQDRERARAAKEPLKYQRRCLTLSDEEVQARIKAGDKFAIRIRIPHGDTRFTDMVSGDLARGNDEIEDFVIARSDGSATYNLAVVVDDHDMDISHVIRGNDHITNTFKQIHIYQALGWNLPMFGHVPLILRPDKRKVSKRLGDKDIGEYRRDGILPEALFNYLSLLGWSSKDDREIYTVDELIAVFDERNLNAANAVFDEEKLLAINRVHIAKKSNDELAELVTPMLEAAEISRIGRPECRRDYLSAVVGLLKERVRRLTDFVDMSGYFFSFDYIYDAKADAKHFTPQKAALLEKLADRFEKLQPLTEESAQDCLTKLARERQLKPADLIHPTRLAVSGVPVGPGLYEMLAALPQPIVVERLRRAAQYIRNKNQT